jgi:hypothetical protein
MPALIPAVQTPQGTSGKTHFRVRLPDLCKAADSPDPAIPPLEFNSSLAKLGIREKPAAEELIDQWTVQFLSGQNAKVDPGTFKTVELAIQDYLDEKRGTLDRSKESTSYARTARQASSSGLSGWLTNRARSFGTTLAKQSDVSCLTQHSQG